MTLHESALHEAIAFGGLDDDTALLDRAERFYRWLAGVNHATRLVLKVGPATKQNTNTPIGGPTQEETMAQLHDNEQFDVAVSAKDSKGFDVPDVFTASVDDTTVATVVAGEDGRTFTVVAGNPGSAVLTVTDGTLAATLAVDVVAGNVALISLAVGDPTPQP